MVQGIKELSSELDGHTFFGQFEIAVKSQVQVIDSRRPGGTAR